MEDNLDIAIQGLLAIIDESPEQSASRIIAEKTLEEINK